MKTILTVTSIALISLFTSCLNTHTVEKNELETVVSDILKLANEKNIKEINAQYIHAKYGIYDVYRTGVVNRFKHLNKIPEHTQEWSVYTTISNVKANRNTKLKKEKVQHNCKNNIWNKEGVFAYSDLKHSLLIQNDVTYPLLSEIINYETKEENKEFNLKEIKKIQYIEANSVCVVDTQSDFIFYLTKIDQKWYVTLIDRLTTDCSF